MLSVGPAAYGVGKASASQQDAGSLGALLIGLAIAAGCAMLAVRYYRRRRARSLLSGLSSPEVSGESR